MVATLEVTTAAAKAGVLAGELEGSAGVSEASKEEASGSPKVMGELGCERAGELGCERSGELGCERVGELGSEGAEDPFDCWGVACRVLFVGTFGR